MHQASIHRVVLLMTVLAHMLIKEWHILRTGSFLCAEVISFSGFLSGHPAINAILHRQVIFGFVLFSVGVAAHCIALNVLLIQDHPHQIFLVH